MDAREAAELVRSCAAEYDDLPHGLNLGQAADLIESQAARIAELEGENKSLRDRVAVLAGEAVRVAANEPEPKHHKFRLVKTKQENKP